MVDAHHGDAPAEGQRLGRGDADQQRADQARSGGHGDGVRSPPADAGLVERPLDDGRDRLDVGAAGQLGHDPAEGGVQVDLAGHHRRAHRQRVVDDGRRRLVAGRLDGQQRPASRRLPPARPRSRPAQIAPSRSTTGSGPRTLTSVEGTSSSCPPSTTRSTAGPRPAATSWAVRGVGAPCGLALVTTSTPVCSQERAAGSRGRGCAPPPRRGRPARPAARSPASKPKARVSGPGHHRRASASAPAVKATPSARTCATEAARTGRCIPSGRPLSR